jgi:hypothetical protein
MRTIVMVATVAIGALRIMWRTLNPESLRSQDEQTADE